MRTVNILGFATICCLASTGPAFAESRGSNQKLVEDGRHADELQRKIGRADLCDFRSEEQRMKCMLFLSADNIERCYLVFSRAEMKDFAEFTLEDCFYNVVHRNRGLCDGVRLEFNDLRSNVAGEEPIQIDDLVAQKTNDCKKGNLDPWYFVGGKWIRWP